MILEIQADDLRIGRHGVDTLLAARAEELERVRHVHLGIVEFRRRRRIHDITALHLHRIGIGRGDMAVAGDILVELHMHQAVFLQCMHLAGLGLARLEEAQGFGDGHLIDERLSGRQLFLGNAVARLDDRRFTRLRRHRHIGDLLEEGADGDGVGRVVRPLIDDLQHVLRTENRRCHLHAAGAPAVGHGHFARGKGHLVAGNGNRLQDRAADHALRLFVDIGEIIARKVCGRHSAASGRSLSCAVSSSRRMRRRRSSSAWKST